MNKHNHEPEYVLNLMMFRRAIATIAVAGLMVSILFGAATNAAAAQNDKVTICHGTGSATNPYVQITISQNAVSAHMKTHDVTLDWPKSGSKPGKLKVGGDFVADPVTGCTAPPTPCIVSAGVTQTDTTVTGTSGNDTIDCTNATPGKTINGGDGDDTITGTAFADTINGDNGDDTIFGGDGADTITGGDGNDTIFP